MRSRWSRVPLALLAFVGLFSHARSARACSLDDPPETYRIDADSTDTKPPVLKDADISLIRAGHLGNHWAGSCGDIGHYTITVEATDDQTEPTDLGFALTLVDGSFPFTLPEDTVIDDDDGGALMESFADDGTAFEGTLEVRVVDHAGNRSEPMRVSAAGDEITAADAEGGTCSVTGAPSTKCGGFMALVGLMLLVTRRNRRPVLCSRSRIRTSSL